MRFTLLTTLVAFTAVACGGEKKSAASQAEAATPTPAAPSAAPASAEPAGAVVEVKMTGNGTSQAAFEPSKLTIKTGTTVPHAAQREVRRVLCGRPGRRVQGLLHAARRARHAHYDHGAITGHHDRMVKRPRPTPGPFEDSPTP